MGKAGEAMYSQLGVDEDDADAEDLMAREPYRDEPYRDDPSASQAGGGGGNNERISTRYRDVEASIFDWEDMDTSRRGGRATAAPSTMRAGGGSPAGTATSTTADWRSTSPRRGATWTTAREEGTAGRGGMGAAGNCSGGSSTRPPPTTKSTTTRTSTASSSAGAWADTARTTATAASGGVLLLPQAKVRERQVRHLERAGPDESVLLPPGGRVARRPHRGVRPRRLRGGTHGRRREQRDPHERRGVVGVGPGGEEEGRGVRQGALPLELYAHAHAPEGREGQEGLRQEGRSGRPATVRVRADDPVGAPVDQPEGLRELRGAIRRRTRGEEQVPQPVPRTVLLLRKGPRGGVVRRGGSQLLLRVRRVRERHRRLRDEQRPDRQARPGGTPRRGRRVVPRGRVLDVQHRDARRHTRLHG
ncbi:hypothetical protein THAOC_17895, partial [Thalassiosira oceanica]